MDEGSLKMPLSVHLKGNYLSAQMFPSAAGH